MNFYFVSVDQAKEKIRLIRVKNVKIAEFFTEEIAVFKYGLSDFSAETFSKIVELLGVNEILKKAYVFDLFLLAGNKGRKDIFDFIKKMQVNFSSQYLVIK
jgi:hypothetical protein